MLERVTARIAYNMWAYMEYSNEPIVSEECQTISTKIITYLSVIYLEFW